MAIPPGPLSLLIPQLFDFPIGHLHLGGMLLVQHIWDKTCLAPNENHSFPAEKNHSSKSSRKLIVIWKLTTEIEVGGDSLVKTVFRGF